MRGKTWGIIAVLVVGIGMGSTLTASAPAVEAAPESAHEVEHQETDLDPDLADHVVAETTQDAEPDPITWAWASCQLQITLNYSAGPGVEADTILRQLAYPIRYLQALGYSAAIGEEIPYTANPAVPTEPGEVLVVATTNRDDIPTLKDSHYRAWAENGAGWPLQTTGRIDIDATRGLSSLVILHELGHIIGLPHKEGTVMSKDGTASNGFDAAETAAIDCRA